MNIKNKNTRPASVRLLAPKNNFFFLNKNDR